MVSRPRRSAATKASENISVQSKLSDSGEIDRPAAPSRRSGRTSARFDDEDDDDDEEDDDDDSVAVPTRQSARGSRRSGASDGVGIAAGRRNRGVKKSYVVDSSPEEDDDDEIDEDAEGEADDNDAMDEDMDAEGEDEDAEEDTPMDSDALARPPAPRQAARAAASKIAADDDDDDEDDDDELSDPDSNMADGTMMDQTMGGEEEEEEEDDEDEDAEGDDQDVDAEGDDDDDEPMDSDEDGSGVGTPNLAKMTKRQRARFEEEPQEYMKLSDEVQAKKVFTAEELSLRRQEMARRRRNLSEKRNEEVKMETINKLLKKQARRVSKKNQDELDGESARLPSNIVRWVNNKNGSVVAAPEEVMNGPIGAVFGEPKPTPVSSGKMVEEVA